MKASPLIIAVGISLAAAGAARSESLGTYGRTYPIKERDAIAAMKDAARKKLANGGKEAMLKGAQDRYMASLSNVKTPAGITAARSNATRYVDVSQVAKETVRSPSGAVLIAAGTRVNPLTIKPLTKKVFFIDARDGRQLQLVKEQATSNDKIILLGGSIFKAGEFLGRRVYLDVPGLAKTMQIRVLPSIVSQEGDKLKVQEVAR